MTCCQSLQQTYQASSGTLLLWILFLLYFVLSCLFFHFFICSIFIEESCFICMQKQSALKLLKESSGVSVMWIVLLQVTAQCSQMENFP